METIRRKFYLKIKKHSVWIKQIKADRPGIAIKVIELQT
jgi:hypothetical protein